MGNANNKRNDNQNSSRSNRSSYRDGQNYTSQFSLSNFVGNLSGRSFLSANSNQTVKSASRPWSRISRRRWNDTTLSNPLEASKTAWPVPRVESIFLPEFNIITDKISQDFDVLNTIANGAFGKVYKVEKVSTGKLYALKVLSKSQVIEENAIRQVKEEARIQEICGHHPFIVGAVSRWQTKKRLYIVSDYVPGGELLSLLEKYVKLPEDVVRLIVAELALVLDFLHNAGIIYRDLKPENVLLDSNYHMQLVDFGLSKWLSIGSRTTTVCGTLKYMAPEVLNREPYGHAVDWWSLGVLTCRMLTDQDFRLMWLITKYPTSIHDKEEGTASKSSILPSVSISEPARKLLNHLLEVNPTHRLKTLRQLQQSAFYMNFNMDDVRSMKVSPKELLDQHYPFGPPDETTDNYNEELRAASQQVFSSFDQFTIV